ncbi:hypothetical protein JHK86_044977 [Glycine max]|nr:hypothetical protein JHK86_044977 [Glycine max]
MARLAQFQPERELRRAPRDEEFDKQKLVPIRTAIRGYTTEFLKGVKDFIDFACQQPKYLNEGACFNDRPRTRSQTRPRTQFTQSQPPPQLTQSQPQTHPQTRSRTQPRPTQPSP